MPTLADLRAAAEANNLDATGTKAELEARLTQAGIMGDDTEDAEPDTATPAFGVGADGQQTAR